MKISSRLFRVGLLGFFALLAVAWFAKPKSFAAELESAGIQLQLANSDKNTVVFSRPGDRYNISPKDADLLRKYLREHEFLAVSPAKTGTPGIVWFDRPSKVWPRRQYQHVWIIEGTQIQVQFEPALR